MNKGNSRKRKITDNNASISYENSKEDLPIPPLGFSSFHEFRKHIIDNRFKLMQVQCDAQDIDFTVKFFNATYGTHIDSAEFKSGNGEADVKKMNKVLSEAADQIFAKMDKRESQGTQTLSDEIRKNIILIITTLLKDE